MNHRKFQCSSDFAISSVTDDVGQMVIVKPESNEYETLKDVPGPTGTTTIKV